MICLEYPHQKMVIFGIDEITTGASNDLERITSVARNMIMDYGMNKEIGHLNINDMEISISLKNKKTKKKSLNRASFSKL